MPQEKQHPFRATGVRILLLSLLLVSSCLMSACGEKAVAKVSSESEAIEIVDRLREHGLQVEKEEVGEGEAAQWSIVLDEGWFGGGEVSHAMQVLHYYGLPREDKRGAKSDNGGVFPSPSVEIAQQLREREADMERKLRIMPGIARVNVTIVLPEDDSIKLDPYPATASVLIVHKDPRPAFTGEQVQNQVAGGVPGLKPEKVTVSMSYEPPPVIPEQDIKFRRRNNIIVAAGVGLVTVLCFLIGILLLQMRRQRARLEALGEDEERAEEAFDETGELTPGEPLPLTNAVPGTGARQLPLGQVGPTVEDSATVK